MPITSPVWVNVAEPMARAMPKSVIFTWPSGVTRMFAGFTSRCTTPAACATARASAIWSPSSLACSGSMSRPCAISSASGRPSTSSITRYGVPVSSRTP